MAITLAYQSNKYYNICVPNLIFMYLLIDLSQKDTIHLSLFSVKHLINCNHNWQNKNLLDCLDNFLARQKKKKADIKGVMAVTGAGSFTSARIAAVIANTLAYALKIPVLAIKENQTKKIQELIPELLKQPIGQYISATYSGQPNITKTKKSVSF